MPLAVVVFLSSCLWWQDLRRGDVVVIIIAHLEWGSSFPSSARPGHSYTSNTFTKTLCLGMGRAQVAATLVQAKPGTGAPRAGLQLCPSGEYTSRVALGAVVMAARQSVAASEEGHQCRQFHQLS